MVMKNVIRTIAIGLAATVVAVALAACGGDPPPPTIAAQDAPGHAVNNGARIEFGAQSPQLNVIACDTARLGACVVPLAAPAHVAVCAVPAESGTALLFENPDMTQTYADYRKSATALDRARLQRERVRDLVAHGIAPQKDLVDAETEYAQTVADRTAQETRLRAAGFDPPSLGRAHAGTAWVMADVPETNVSYVHAGEEVQVACAAYPGVTFNGRVDAIGDVVDPATRTLKVRILVASAREPLRAGMFGTARFEARAPRAVTVPRGAIVNVQGNAYVFVRSGDAFDRRAVRIGGETDSTAIVDNGLRGGEPVAVSGTMLLKGMSFGY